MISIYSLLFGVAVAGVIFTLALALRSGGEVETSELPVISVALA